MDHCSYPLSSTFFHATPYPQASTAREDFILGRSLLFMNPHASLYYQFASTRITPTFCIQRMCTFIHYLHEDRTSLRHLLPCHFYSLHSHLSIFYVMYMPWTVEAFRHTLLFTLHRVVYIVDFFTTLTPHGFFMYC